MILAIITCTVLMRFFGYPYNDLVICKDSPDYLALSLIKSYGLSYGYDYVGWTRQSGFQSQILL